MRRAEGCQCSSDYERLDMTATQTLKKKQPDLQRPWTWRNFRDFAEKNDATGRSSIL
jgi:hypothetical protein